MDDGAKGLRQDDRQAAFVQLGAGETLVLRCPARVERNEGIDAKQKLDTFIERNRGMQRLVERAVDVMFAVDHHGREHPGQRGRSLDRRRNRNMVAPGAAERDRRAGVEVGRDEKKPAVELAKIIGAAGRREQPLEKGPHGAIVEYPRRERVRQRRQRFHEPSPERVAQVLHCRLTGEPRQAGRAPHEFGEGGTKEHLGRQRGIDAVVDEKTIHLRGRDAVRQSSCDKTTGGNADIDVEGGQIDALERVGQREQRADLVDPAQRTAASQREAHA